MANIGRTRKQTMDQIAHELDVIDQSVDGIASNALSSALREEDDLKANEIFESVREWVHCYERESYEAQDYITFINKLVDISIMSGQKQAYTALTQRLKFFKANEQELKSVLDEYRIQDLHDRLRNNWHLN